MILAVSSSNYQNIRITVHPPPKWPDNTRKLGGPLLNSWIVVYFEDNELEKYNKHQQRCKRTSVTVVDNKIVQNKNCTISIGNVSNTVEPYERKPNRSPKYFPYSPAQTVEDSPRFSASASDFSVRASPPPRRSQLRCKTKSVTVVGTKIVNCKDCTILIGNSNCTCSNPENSSSSTRKYEKIFTPKRKRTKVVEPEIEYCSAKKISGELWW